MDPRTTFGLALTCALFLAPVPLRADEAAVGTGALYLRMAEGYTALPLVSMVVEIEVTGILARGTVRQTFSSDAPATVGAVYMFPLPERAAVDGMQIRTGDRTIEAVVREREVARREFEEARQAGRQASLLEQHRPNLFRMNVARIEPSETVEVRLTYSQELDVEDDRFGLAFPLTFTPRYRPPRAVAPAEPAEPAGDGAPVFRPAHSPRAPRATLAVHIDAGLPIRDLRSPSHAIRSTPDGRALWVVPDDDVIVADRDFVLSWTVERADEPQATLWLEDRDDGRYGLLMLASPGDETPAGAGLPTQTVFVVDTSGSMAGPSIVVAREALLAALARLRPEDAFGLVRFSGSSAAFHAETVPAGGDEIEAANVWVGALKAEGGTEILGALRHGLDLLDPGFGGDSRIVLITDGAVTNEAELLAELGPRFERTRLHVVGIGAAPNRWLMRKLAQIGRGAAAFLPSRDGLLDEIQRFLERIDRPVLADAELAWPDGPPLESYPERLPDLHAGEFAFVSLRLAAGRTVRGVALGGRIHSGWRDRELEVREDAAGGGGIAARWARAKVEELLDGLHEGHTVEEVRPAVVEVATEFNLVTPYTSLVAIELRPSGDGPAPLLPVAAALPPGGELPAGGTSGPLRLAVGLALLVSGAALLACFSRGAA